MAALIHSSGGFGWLADLIDPTSRVLSSLVQPVHTEVVTGRPEEVDLPPWEHFPGSLAAPPRWAGGKEGPGKQVLVWGRRGEPISVPVTPPGPAHPLDVTGKSVSLKGVGF